VNNPDKAKTLPQATTDASGKYSVKKLLSNVNYYAFVGPSAGDADHLPGGDASRVAFAPKAVGKGGLHIQMSWNTPSTATFIGTTACPTCHGPGRKVDTTSNKHHGHALMFHKPGADSPNQDAASHPGSSWN